MQGSAIRSELLDDLNVLFEDTEQEYYSRDESFFRDALGYQATRSWHLEPLAEYLRLQPDDVFVDLGCGKGRVLCYMAMHDIKRAVGVELRQELAEFAREKARRIRARAPVDVFLQDAADFFSPDGTIFYLFNPFGQGTLGRVLRNIKNSVDARPRPVRIVYNNSICAHQLDRSGWLEREGHIAGTDIVIWHGTGNG